MNRDPDLCLAILKYIGNASISGTLHSPFSINGYSDLAILSHVELLIHEGRAEGKVFLGLFGPFLARITKLTASGQDALRAAEWQRRIRKKRRE